MPSDAFDRPNVRASQRHARRRFLTHGVAACGGLAWIASSPSAAVRMFASPVQVRAEPLPTLVLVQLSGGNDGLNTVIPFADDAYHAARPTLRIQDPIRITDTRGLHPRLSGLARWYEQGKLAIVEGCGYPEPNRSHFESFEIWHTADARGRHSGEGWIGRLCAAQATEQANPHRLVHIGSSVPYALESTRCPPICFSLPEAYRWVGDPKELEVACPEDGASALQREPSSLDFLRKVQREARASSAAVRRAAEQYAPRVEYPNDAFAAALRTAAALIQGGLGCRVISVELGGFDTHNDQKGRHEQQLGRLDGGLSAFADDLKDTPGAARTLVLVYSEFGRRVAENGSRGTDHGTAAPMFVLGERVRGGLYGKHPSLVDLAQGDLVHTTDFRSVYATVLERWFMADARSILRDAYPTLSLI
jgi:uncharacterized protein (DUF1501 family)